MAIESFKNKETEEIANGRKSKRTPRLFPAELHFAAYKKLIFLNSIRTVESLRAWPGLKFEYPKGNRRGYMSVRINDQYRICFKFIDGQFHSVEIVEFY